MQIRSWKVLSLAIALAPVACGQGTSNPAGARLEGMLDPASLSALRGEPVQVTVAGTSRSTATDVSGRFTFDDLAPGAVVLRFRGPGVDVTARISGLRAGKTRQIEVRFSKDGAEVRHPHRNEIALVGAIQAVAAASITVSGLVVDADASTRIRAGGAAIGLADLKVGDVVRVEGSLQAGKVLARSIELQVPQGVGEVLLRGRITSIDTAGSKFAVSGLTVTTDARTRFPGGRTLADLQLGDRVLVQGTLQPGGSVKARLVVKLEPRPPRDREVEFEGKITSITPPDRLQVAGRTVVVDASTEIEGENDQRLTFADLKVGDRVEVEGFEQADGTILARQIEREEEDEKPEHH